MPVRLLVMLAALATFASAVAQDGQLAASVDRTTIRANESFRYILRAEGQLSGRPDLSSLAVDFDVLETWRSSSIQIVNGRTAQVAEWVVELMPRQAGTFELPPVELGGVLSNAVRVDILPAPDQSQAAADVFMEVELDRPVSYVQAQAIYTLRLFVGVGTGRQTLTAPLVEGGEAIVEKLGGDREYQTVRGDRVYNVRERNYAIFPQTPGVLTVGPAVYEAMIVPNAGFARQQRLRSDVLELQVQAAVPPPPEYPQAVWLPASALVIAESWSDEGDAFEQGVPRTRTLSVIADGLLETQLPELVIPTTPGFRQYPDQPELERRVTANGIRAERTERFAVIAQTAGAVDLPPIEVPWWNVDEARWEIARVEGRTIDVLPSADAPSPAEPSVQSRESPFAADSGDGGVWPWISAALAAGWLATIAAWLYTARAVPRRSAAAAERPTSARQLIRQLGAACRVNDAQRSRALLLEWAGLQFPDDPPTSLGALAARLPGPLGDAIAALEAALYGPTPAEWRGEQLAQLVRETQAVRRRRADDDEDPLLPLYR